MNFFGPTPPSSPVTELNAPGLRRAFARARIVTGFITVQGLVQVVGFLAGILLVRVLSQSEYAYYTIANTMQGTINLLADIGISIGLVSIGGRVWHDRDRFGQLIVTGLRLRRLLGVGAVLVVTPVLIYMLRKNGASAGYTALLTGIVLLGAGVQLSVGVLGVVPRLRSDIRVIQMIDLTGAFVRLAILLVLVFFFLNAGVAVAVFTVAFFLQYLLLRRYVAGVINLRTQANPDDRRAMMGFIRNQAANALFYCFQGQITILLISLLSGSASSVAEVGALGRLGMIFTVLSTLLANIFVPAFARCHNARTLRWLYTGIVGAVAAFSAAVLFVALLFPHQLLFILGNKYAHLENELLLMVAASVLSALTSAVWSLNASKAWVTGSWTYIPLTLATQAALIPFLDLSSVHGVLLFNLVSATPNLLVNAVLSYRGFRRPLPDGPT